LLLQLIDKKSFFGGQRPTRAESLPEPVWSRDIIALTIAETE
jgi:hypothetical protein